MKKIKHIRAWIALIFFSQILKAEIQFVFIQKGTSKYLKRVELSCSSKSYFSDKDGIVRVDDVLKNCEEFKIYKVGYRKLSLKSKELNLNEKIEILLEADQLETNTVLIKGKKRDEVSKKVISIEEARAVAPKGDPAQIIKLLPGVQSNGFSSKVVVRGSAPEDSKYYVDGMDVPFLFHSIGGLSILPKSSIENVDFIAGGFGVESGEATGGIIRLRTPKAPVKDRKTEVTVNLPFYSGFYYQNAIDDKQSFSLGARRSYVDFFTRNLSKESIIVPIFYDLYAQWNKQTDDGSIKITGISSSDFLKLSVPNDNANQSGNFNFELGTTFYTLGLEWSHKLDENWRVDFQPQITYTKVKTDILDNFIRIDGPTLKLSTEFQRRLSENEKAYIGLEISQNWTAVHVLAPRVNSDDPFVDYEDAPVIESQTNYKAATSAIWLARDFVIEKLKFVPGIRIYNQSFIKKTDVDPRISAYYKFTPENTFKLALGVYGKSPEPSQTDSKFGNPKLNFEKSIHYVTGWEKDWDKDWNTDLEFYYKKGFKIVRSNPSTVYENSGELESKGFELFLRRNMTDQFFGWISYTLSQTKDKESSEKPWYPNQYDETHVLNLVGNYKFTPKFQLGARFNYHTGDRNTPVDFEVYNANYSKYQPRSLDEHRYSERLPNYYQVDLYSNYDFTFDRWKLAFKTGLEYLALKRPVFGVSYNYDYSKKKYFQGLPPIPYIEIEGVF